MNRCNSRRIATARGDFGAYTVPCTDAPILLCLHGGPGMDSQYLHGLRHTVSAQFELVFLDQRGDGLSRCDNAHLPGGIEQYADDVVAVTAQLRSEYPARSIGLLGHSFGGFVAQAALARADTSLCFGVLANTAADLSWTTECAEHCARLQIDPRAAEIEALIMSGGGTDDDLRDMCVQYAPLYFPELPLAQAQQRLQRGTYSVAAYRNSANIYATMQLNPGAIRVPCLVIGSALDYVIPWAAQERLATHIPDVTTVCIADVGHFPFVQKDSEFAQAVMAMRAYCQ